MAAQVADVSDFKHQIVARLPLNVERLVHGVRQLVGAIVVGKGEQRGSALDCANVGQLQIGRIAAGSGAERVAPRVLESAAIGVAERAARLLIHPRWSLVHAERSARDHARRKARRKIREQLTTVVVQAPARANDYLVVKRPRTPRDAHARRKAPLSPSQSRITYALRREIRIISRDDEAVR